MGENRKVSVMLKQDQFSFLEDFEERCANLSGSGISKASIIRCLLKLFDHLEVDVRHIRTEDELLSRLLKPLSGGLQQVCACRGLGSRGEKNNDRTL